MMIVKIGGGEAIAIDAIVEDLAVVDEQYVVVHGANAARDRLAESLGWEKKTLTSVSGYTSVYSDERAIDPVDVLEAPARFVLYLRGLGKHRQ